MSIFGRRQDPSARPRSAEDRERARIEREARRAAREGRPAPAAPPPSDEPAWDSVEFEAPPVDRTERAAEEGLPASDSVSEPAADWSDPEPTSTDWSAPEPTADDASLAEEWTGGEREPAADEATEWQQPPSWDEAARAASTEPAPAEHQAPVAEEEPEPPQQASAPSPTLDEELAAVDGGWAAEQQVDHEEPGQETVEWDVLANRPKARPQPPTGPGGVDTPTVEWDVMAEQPKAPVKDEEEEPRFVRTDDPAEQPVAAATPAERRAQALAARRERAEATSGATRGGGGRSLPPTPPAPGERRPRRRFSHRRAFLAIVVLPLIGVGIYLAVQLFQPFAGAGGERVRVDVPQNSTAGDIGDLLERRGIVASGFWFTVRARLDGGNMMAGEYTMRRDMAYGDAIKTLSAGPPPPRTVKVAIPEGRARRETAPLVRDAGLDGSYLAASERSDSFNPRRYGAPRKLASLEGFLFPATYELEPGSSSGQLVSQQLRAFRENIDKVSMRTARRRNLTTYDVLIIASMVDREATLDSERRQIAAVIHNRLRQGMPLGIDATIRFATRNWTQPLKQSELAIDSPYNTRRRTGLPPGPIGSPGLASIKAAANPASVKHLFYVVKPCGNGAHSFSSTDAQFQKDVAAYNRKRDELGGKSPVDC